MKLLIALAVQAPCEVLDLVIPHPLDREDLVEEIIDLRPLTIILVGLILLVIQRRGERDVIFGLSVPELARIHVEYAVRACEEMPVLVNLLGELLVEEQLGTFTHNVRLERSLLELRCNLEQLLLRDHINTIRASALDWVLCLACLIVH